MFANCTNTFFICGTSYYIHDFERFNVLFKKFSVFVHKKYYNKKGFGFLYILFFLGSVLVNTISTHFLFSSCQFCKKNMNILYKTTCNQLGALLKGCKKNMPLLKSAILYKGCNPESRKTSLQIQNQ